MRPSRSLQTPGQPVCPKGNPVRFENFVVADLDHRGVEAAAVAMMLERVGHTVARRIGFVPADIEIRVLGQQRREQRSREPFVGSMNQAYWPGPGDVLVGR